MSRVPADHRLPWHRAPIIAALRDLRDVSRLQEAPHVRCAFLLGGTLGGLPPAVAELKARRIASFVHLDLVRGLSATPDAVGYIAGTGAAGLLTTHPGLVAPARQMGLCTILRLFAVDSRALDTGITQAQHAHPDAVEVLPGVVPRVIRNLASVLEVPVITGGFVQSEEDVRESMAAGAAAISTSSVVLWKMAAMFSGEDPA